MVFVISSPRRHQFGSSCFFSLVTVPPRQGRRASAASRHSRTHATSLPAVLFFGTTHASVTLSCSAPACPACTVRVTFSREPSKKLIQRFRVVSECRSVPARVQDITAHGALLLCWLEPLSDEQLYRLLKITLGSLLLIRWQRICGGSPNTRFASRPARFIILVCCAGHRTTRAVGKWAPALTAIKLRASCPSSLARSFFYLSYFCPFAHVFLWLGSLL